MAEAGVEILNLLRRDNLVSENEVCVTPLPGGVSSNVFLIQDADRSFVVKQALPRLKVKDLWKADTSRNRNEYEYLRYVGRIVPESVPSVFAVANDYFTMEYIGPELESWKQLLLSGLHYPEHALRAAKLLGTIHRESAADPAAKRLFDTTANFHQLRTEPYLITTGQRHPALRKYFEEEASRLESTREALVHGDYSPKNFLVGRDRLVLLDCEVAWYGDPAFDLAFLLCHLLLKSLYHAPRNVHMDQIMDGVIETYYREQKFTAALQQRCDRNTGRLLLLLLLARVDGKSPVEYLNAEDKLRFVRAFVASELERNGGSLREIAIGWFRALQRQYKGDLRKSGGRQ